MPKAILKALLPLLIGFGLTTACQPGTPGVDAPLSVEDGTIQVVGVERRDNFAAPDGTLVRPRRGLQFLFVKVATTGEARNYGFYLVDANGEKYDCGGLYQGSAVCQVPPNASGLSLWYSDDAQVPLYGLLGEAPPPTRVANQPADQTPIATQPDQAPPTEAASPPPLATQADLAPGTPGVDTPLSVEEGTIQVTGVARRDSFTSPDGSVVRPQPGLEFLFVTVATTGAAKNYGFRLVDEGGQNYDCGALYQGSAICQVPLNARNLTLWYSDAAQVPLTSFLGEASQPTGGGYEVMAGDTCDSIALMNGTSRQSLIEANQLASDCSNLQVGQRLIIPTPVP